MDSTYRDFMNDGEDGSSAGHCRCEDAYNDGRCFANSPYCMNQDGNFGWVECLNAISGKY